MRHFARPCARVRVRACVTARPRDLDAARLYHGAMPLLPGQNAPWFVAPTPSNPEFAFDTTAGRYVLMLFLPDEQAPRLMALRALAANQRLFDEVKACALVVYRDASTAGLRDVRGLRWMFDADGAITRRYGPEPHWLLLDPTL